MVVNGGEMVWSHASGRRLTGSVMWSHISFLILFGSSLTLGFQLFHLPFGHLGDKRIIDADSPSYKQIFHKFVLGSLAQAQDGTQAKEDHKSTRTAERERKAVFASLSGDVLHLFPQHIADSW